jgi:LmbE family N-acetylglucosaminyl deacetylase
MEGLNVLFLGAHTDDIELACGATVSKYVNAGHQVSCVAFSNCNNPELSEEFSNSMNKMKVKYHYVSTYPSRILSNYRQQILEYLLTLRTCNFDIVFTHSINDTHQDHKVIAEETFRAFKNSTIYGYAHPWNTVEVSNSCMSSFSEEDLQNKIEAIGFYKSQSERAYTSPDYIKSLAITNGVIAGTKYAEAFQCVRVII